MSSPILTVIGATGAQGGSVVTAVQSIPALSHYSIRALTRDPSKPSSQALAAKGVDVRAADLNDPASLAKAFEGSTAVFAVTNFWDGGSAPADTAVEAQRETAQGKAIADAAIAAGVAHLIFSTLPHTSTLTGGKLTHIRHFDAKADVQTYIEGKKAGTGLAASYVLPGFYMSNFATMAQPGDGNTLSINLPWHPTETKVPLFDAARDTGIYAAALLLLGPQAADGKSVEALSEWLSPEQIAAQYAQAQGKTGVFNQIPEAVLKGFLPPSVADEMVENMVLVRDWSYYGVKGKEEAVLAASKAFVQPTGLQLATFADFLQRSA